MKRIWTIAAAALILAGCGSEEAADDKGFEESGSVSLQNLDMQVDGLSFVMEGQARATESELFYEVTLAGETITEEQPVQLNGESNPAGWTEFSIEGEIPGEAAEREEPPIIVLYGKNTAGERVNGNYIPVDIERK